MSLQERIDSEQFAWVAISECAAVRFNQAEDGERPDALIAYGGGFTNTIRKLQFSRIPYRNVGHLLWKQESPPGKNELHAWWHSSLPMRDEEDLKAAREIQEVTLQWNGRQPDESMDEFYKRVAAIYLILQRNTGTPLVSLAEIAGVSKNTAAQRVKQARKRGYLSAGTT